MTSTKCFLILAFLLMFAVCVSAQRNPYPNEINGYRFFKNGKLKDLRLAFSTKEDVKKIFGDNCESHCDYNDNWRIVFNYVYLGGCMTVYQGERKSTLCPAEPYDGKLSSIQLHPKKRTPFGRVSFSNFGVFGGGSSNAHDGKGGGTQTAFDVFGDEYGLSYSIFDEVTLTTRKNLTELKKGDLLSVEYKLSQELINKIFIKIK